jgi:transglutaminase-like putative cysteine protease
VNSRNNILRDSRVSQVPLSAVLKVTAAAAAVLIFFMGWELLGALYAWGFMALLAAAFLIEWRGWPHPPRRLINLAALAALLAVFSRLRFNYVIEALMEALLLMTAVKMLEEKRARDYVQIALLGLVALVGYAMLSMEKAFIVYCFGMSWVLALTLLLSTWFGKDPGARLSLRELRQLVWRASALFGVMLPICLLLFFLLPRASAPLWASRGQYGVFSTGFSDQVRLGEAAAIQTDDRVAFRAAMPPVNPQMLYWRGTVLDFFGGNTWSPSRSVSRRSELSPSDFSPEEGDVLVKQEISLEAGNRGYLFALDRPLSITGVNVFSEGDGVFRHRVWNRRESGRSLRYEAVSVLSPRILTKNTRKSPPLSGAERRRYLMLPDNFSPRLRTLTEEMTRDLNAGEKIAAMMRFLASDFSYSLEGLPQSRNALERFLFVEKKGNCEYFASAMGVMLRMAGIPARLVAGYRGGFYNDVGGYYIVQEQHAHVWVEAWDGEAEAWTRFDPTPVAAEVSAPTRYSAWRLYLDLLDYQWSKLVVNYNWELQAETAQSLWETLRNPRASLSPSWDGFRRFGSALSLPAAFLGALALAAAFFFLFLHLARRAGNYRPEMALLKKFLSVLRRRGYRRRESEGLEEFIERVDDPRLRALALPFVRGFEEFYYKDRPMDAAALSRLRAYIDYIQKPI